MTSRSRQALPAALGVAGLPRSVSRPSLAGYAGYRVLLGAGCLLALAVR